MKILSRLRSVNYKPSASPPAVSLSVRRRLRGVIRIRKPLGAGRGSIPSTLWICLKAINLNAC